MPRAAVGLALYSTAPPVGGGAPPAVFSVTPNVGVPAGGTSVALFGSGFTGATSVKFDGVNATSVVVLDDMNITCNTPAGSNGLADVSVTTANGTGTLINGFYYAPASPTASNLQGWYRGDDYTAGTWTDNSGNTRDLTQGTGANQPTLVSSDLNGYDTVSFDGSNDFVEGVAISNFITNSAYYTYSVIYVSTVAGNVNPFYANDSVFGDSLGYFGLFAKNNGPTIGMYNWDGSEDNAITSFSTGQWIIVTTYHVGGNVAIRINDGSFTTTASGNTQVITGLLRVGKSTNGAFLYTGKIAELLVYNADMGSSDSDILSYLTGKYGLQ